MRQFDARARRHLDLRRDQENAERLRAGLIVAAIRNGPLKRQGRDWWDEKDVFPELGDFLPDPDEQDEGQIKAAMAGWPGLRRIHRA